MKMKKTKWWLFPFSLLIIPIAFTVTFIRGLIYPMRPSTPTPVPAQIGNDHEKKV